MSRNFSFLGRKARSGAGAANTHNRNGDSSSSSTSTSIPSAPTDFSTNSSRDMKNNNAANTNGDLVNILDSQYARARRELLELVRDLRALGSDKDLDIPQIAVIGKQSAGKSSLVEAVAGINVPRDAGTCTRCPMECTILTSSERWSCSISLRGEGLNTAFSPEITSKADVELWIRRAQAAVLCPHLDTNTFKTKSRDEIKQITDWSSDSKVLRFSNTIVEVKILDPNGADLVFIDLPGLIPNADDEVVSQVEGMVKDYISFEYTIILVTVPAEDDLENQKAMKLAKEADPDGKRTIGVVTKADKIGAGETGRQSAWKDIFQGRTRDHRLDLGYYAVSLPTDEDRARNVTPREVRQNAARVFDTVAPWKDLKAIIRPTRLGVEALIRDISPLLMRMLVDAIPRLKKAIDELLAACLDALAALPKRPTMASPAAELVRLVVAFCAAVRETVDGASEDKTFVHRSLEHYRSLRFAIRGTAPDFRPFEAWEEYTRPMDPPSQQCEDAAAAVVMGGVADASLPSSILGPDLEEETGVLPMGLLDVRKVINDCTAWELPPYVPYLAKTRLIREFVGRWSKPSNACFASIQDLVNEYVYDKLIPQHFDQFPILKQFVATQLRELIDEFVNRADVGVQQVLERETLPYFTQNGHYLETTRQVWLGHYKVVRRFRDADYRLDGRKYSEHSYRSAEERAVSELRKLPQYKDATVAELLRLLPADGFDDELDVMTSVRSFFQVAYKRVIDNVPQTIHHDFVASFASGLQPYLLEKLDLGGQDASERLEGLLEEDPNMARDRKDLEDRKKQLETMKTRLNSFNV